MSNPTSNFGWVMPTSTDLVTDLPADFAVFGQGVDTTMADLKGGTTGQILAKASATDMDFAWIANDQGDITGVTAGTGMTVTNPTGPVPTVTNAMATAITTNGDTLYGTGSGTFSRLGIGSTGQVLTVAAGIPSWETASSGSLQVAGKNAVINGDFLINQRAFTSNTTTGAYNFDRWLQQNSGGTFTVTPQTFTPGAAPIATYEGRKYLQGITASQSAAGHYAIITQRIEDVTRYAGTTVTISFFAKADTGTPKIGVELWQDYGSGGSPSTAATVAQSSVTLTTSWARYSVSMAVPSLTGKTLGTTANTSYLELNLWTSAGSTYNTRASSIGIQNFTASIWGVQLEYASSATYFTTATGTLQGELAACQRYYWRTTATGTIAVGSGTTEDANRGIIFINNPVAMRIAPTSVDSATLTVTDMTSYTLDVTSVTGITFGTTGGRVTFNTAGGQTTNRAAIGQTKSTGGYIGFNAEL
jgi:hypothetical protein